MGIAVAVIIIIVGGMTICSISRVVNARNQIDEAWNNIEAALERRRGLVFNIAEMLKDRVADVQILFETTPVDYAGDRSEAQNIQEAESAFSRQIGQVLASAKSDPEIRSNKHFVDLTERLAGIEESIRFANREYNSAVWNYNQRLRTFLGAFLEKNYGFDKEDHFNMEYVTKPLNPDNPTDKERMP